MPLSNDIRVIGFGLRQTFSLAAEGNGGRTVQEILTFAHAEVPAGVTVLVNGTRANLGDIVPAGAVITGATTVKGA